MPAGRPTKYRKEYTQQMIDFFDIPANKTIVKYKKTTNNTKTGATSETEVVEEVANNLPTLERFAHSIGLDSVDTIKDWADAKHKDGRLKYPEFTRAYYKIKEIQKSILVENGLKGLYQSNFAIFVATNFTDMQQKQHIDSKSEVTKKKVIDMSKVSKKVLEKIVDKRIKKRNE